MNRVFAKDTFKVTAATITTGWKPGQFFTLSSAGEASLATGDNALFMGVDADTVLSAPPTGSVLTGIYGVGSKVYINSTAEKAASSGVFAFANEVLAATVGANLWVNASGKLSTTGSVIRPVGLPSESGSVISPVIAKVIQVPAASNDYTLGVLFRI
jgi:hypothetical protein